MKSKANIGVIESLQLVELSMYHFCSCSVCRSQFVNAIQQVWPQNGNPFHLWERGSLHSFTSLNLSSAAGEEHWIQMEYMVRSYPIKLSAVLSNFQLQYEETDEMFASRLDLIKGRDVTQVSSSSRHRSPSHPQGWKFSALALHSSARGDNFHQRLKEKVLQLKASGCRAAPTHIQP